MDQHQAHNVINAAAAVMGSLYTYTYGAKRGLINPYLAAVIFGTVIAGVYIALTGELAVSLILGSFYGISAVGFSYFWRRIEKREDSERPPVPDYQISTMETVRVRWEYVPMVAFFLVVLSGMFVLMPLLEAHFAPVR
jgi:hypothetical protein